MLVAETHNIFVVLCLFAGSYTVEWHSSVVGNSWAHEIVCRCRTSSMG